MPRIPRQDEPGCWHHVFNRAIARRTLFERRADYRYFLASLARAVRRGEIEVHAYCLMGTHYHLLVRSLEGRMASAMHRVQLAYSRWFNRSRKRDGSLVRGRYGSKPVRSLNYRRAVLRYIDLNPCRARLALIPSAYAWGSAHHYARPSGPPWLQRCWVEAENGYVGRPYRPTQEALGWPGVVDDRAITELSQLVEARMGHDDGEDLLDDIVSASDRGTRRWMIQKAILADGTRPGVPLLVMSQLDRIITKNQGEAWVVQRGQSKRDGWLVLRVGLGRDLCGLTLRALAETVGISPTRARRIYAIHRAEVREETTYAHRAAELAGQEIESWARA